MRLIDLRLRAKQSTAFRALRLSCKHQNDKKTLIETGLADEKIRRLFLFPVVVAVRRALAQILNVERGQRFVH